MSTYDNFFPVISGVATAFTWAIIVFLYCITRDYFLKRKIKKALKKSKFAGELLIPMVYSKIGIKLDNPTHKTIVVRHVIFYCKSVKRVKNGTKAAGVGMCYVGCFLPVNPPIAPPIPDERGYVEIPPYSDGCWQLTLNSFESMRRVQEPKKWGFDIEIQYEGLLKKPKILKIFVHNPELTEHLGEAFKQYCETKKSVLFSKIQ